jgi:hypothetical protein
MITTCRRCKRAYWRYREDTPPPRYCSQLCHDLRGVKLEPTHARPERILSAIRAHLRAAHPGASINEWLDCERCDDLQAAYAEALDWHLARSA